MSSGGSWLEWVALILSVASLLVAAAAFYRVEMRGPVIRITPPLQHRQRLRWDGPSPPDQQTIEVQFLIINDGPRAGMLEAFKATASFMPHEPRVLAAGTVLRDSHRGSIIPTVVRDGEIKDAMLIVEITSQKKEGMRHEERLSQLAHDLRELMAVRVVYSYTAWRRTLFGRLRAVESGGHVDVALTELRARVRETFESRSMLQPYKVALAILGDS